MRPSNPNLLNFVHDFVNVYAVTVGFGLVVTIAACVKQQLVLFILLRVQHVVAFLKVKKSIYYRDLYEIPFTRRLT